MGCTDKTACNYDAGAKVDSGKCVYEANVCGVCGGDKSVVCKGCGDRNACNYDPAGRPGNKVGCRYARKGFNCRGECVAGVDCMKTCGGSVKPNACGVCGGDPSKCKGCMDTKACNFDPSAKVAGAVGSCKYPRNALYDCKGNCVADVDCGGVCGGKASRDACGVCGGNGKTCETLAPATTTVAMTTRRATTVAAATNKSGCVAAIDCKGICGVKALKDSCGICGGDGTMCDGRCPPEPGFCVQSNGRDQNKGVLKVNNVNGNSTAAQASCVAACRRHTCSCLFAAILCARARVRMYVCVCVCVCVCLYRPCMYVCMYACMYVCMYVSVLCRVRNMVFACVVSFCSVCDVGGDQRELQPRSPKLPAFLWLFVREARGRFESFFRK